MKRTLTLIAVLAAATLTAGCAAAAEPDPTPAATEQAATVTPGTSQRSDYLPPVGTEPGGDFATLQSQRDAAQVAEATMTAFVAHERTYDAWWADLSQYLTPEAAVIWEYTDPRLVTASALTGPATVVEAPTSTLVIVDVPTDAGSWRLELVKFVEVDAGDGVWKVFTLQPPEQP